MTMAPPRKLQPGEGQQELFGSAAPSATDRFRQLYGNVGYSNAGIGPPQAGPGFISESKSDPPALGAGPAASSPGTPGAATGAASAAPGFNVGNLPNLNFKPGARSPYMPGNPAPPASANLSPGATPMRQQVGRMAQGAVNQYQLSKVPGTPQAEVADGVKSFAKWSVRPASHNLDTMMQNNWSSESKNLVYGRGVSEPGPHDIETDSMRGPSFSRTKAEQGNPLEKQKATAQQPHSNPHPTTGHGVHMHDEGAFYPVRSGGGSPGAPPMLMGAGAPPRPMGPAGGASRTQDYSPDLLYSGNRAGAGANPWFNQHDQLVSGLNARPVQGIGANKEN